MRGRMASAPVPSASDPYAGSRFRVSSRAQHHPSKPTAQADRLLPERLAVRAATHQPGQREFGRLRARQNRHAPTLGRLRCAGNPPARGMARAASAGKRQDDDTPGQGRAGSARSQDETAHRADWRTGGSDHDAHERHWRAGVATGMLVFPGSVPGVMTHYARRLAGVR